MSDESYEEVTLHRRTPDEQNTYVLMRLALVEERLNRLESARKGGRPAKKIQVKAEHVCGVAPLSDSATCPFASLYRRRQGCMGDACVLASSTYYKDRA